MIKQTLQILRSYYKQKCQEGDAQSQLAVQIHHLYRSKVIVDTLQEMGLCCSYTEVIRFEKNAADCVKPDVLVGDVYLLDMSVLFVADNLDYNVITIDAKGTFHGMGVNDFATPGKRTNHLIPRRHIPELKTRQTFLSWSTG